MPFAERIADDGAAGVAHVDRTRLPASHASLTGSIAIVEKRQKPPALAQAAGNEALTSGQFGNFIVWKTGEYNGTTPVKLAKEAQLTAMGPWAVTAP